MTSASSIHEAGHGSWYSVTTQRDRVGKELGSAFRMGRTHVNLWPIHVDVWQTPSQYCKVITLQLKLIN